MLQPEKYFFAKKNLISTKKHHFKNRIYWKSIRMILLRFSFFSHLHASFYKNKGFVSIVKRTKNLEESKSNFVQPENYKTYLAFLFKIVWHQWQKFFSFTIHELLFLLQETLSSFYGSYYHYKNVKFEWILVCCLIGVTSVTIESISKSVV